METMVWDDAFAVLSGQYLYYYENKKAAAHLDYIDIKDADVSRTGQ
jgi:hypothetical protein